MWWYRGGVGLDSAHSLLAQNIAGIASSPWQVMFNDQPPANSSSHNYAYPVVDAGGDTYYPSGGHMKGALGAHYMVQHSIPRCCWHTADGTYAVGSKAEGQHAMCISGLGLTNTWQELLVGAPHPFSPSLGPYSMPQGTPPPAHKPPEYKLIVKPPATYATGVDMVAAHLVMGDLGLAREVRTQSWRLIAQWGGTRDETRVTPGGALGIPPPSLPSALMLAPCPR